MRITTRFPHWFCPNFARYGDHESDLPVDQHQLIALVVPRAVYVASANEDLWADQRGEWESLVQASPIYKLLGLEAVTPETPMSALDQPTHRGQTGHHIRSGRHNLTAWDWDRFMDFADQLWR